VPGSGHDAILADLAEAVGDLAVLRSSTNSEAVFTDPGHPWIAGALETLTRVSGNKIDPEYVSYFTDASALSKAMGEPPTLLLGPGDAGMAHQTNEWCSVNNIERVSEMYYEIMKNEH
jgi:succinyl-diaminopimelate desuccinylase